MTNKAPRLPYQFWRGLARGALLALCVLLGGPVAADGQPIITGARFETPTTRYGHLVLGKGHNWANLTVRLSNGTDQTVTLPKAVFEDTAPRLVDMTGDGAPEILTVEAKASEGARIVIYGLADGQVTRLAATPPVGRSNRWYAPVGAADFDGDGAIEIAFIDRPHLAKTLRVWRAQVGENDALSLTEIATQAGLTNHRIGEPFISGGIRTCDGLPQMVLASANWSSIQIVSLENGALNTTPLDRPATQDALTQTLACD